MAVGDFSIFAVNSSSTYHNFVPTGSNQFMVISVAGANQIECYTYNDAGSANDIANTGDTVRDNPRNTNNFKQIIDNTNYLVMYGDYSTLANMVQIA